MQNTKGNILQEALKLFSKEGYEAVSVRDIAKVLNISQSALYKHYANKRDIFDSIIARMINDDYEQSKAFEVPEGLFSEMAEAYRSTEIEKIKNFTFAKFRYLTEDEFASDFRKMLTLEQYRSAEMMEFYQQYLSGGVISYLEDLFREISLKKDNNLSNFKQLAIEFYAPIYMLMNLYDGAKDKSAITSMAKIHIDNFIEGLKKQ